MTLRHQANVIRNSIFQFIAECFQVVARGLGFPENPGMPILPGRNYSWEQPSFRDRLPVRPTFIPPPTSPKNYIEVLIGELPKPDIIPRHFYESKVDGFYNFYVMNYKDNVFLPDKISEYLQIKLNWCLDLTFLEVFREVFFCTFIIYFYMISIRYALGWFMNINPYTFPFNMLLSTTDWVEEIGHLKMPTLGGVPLVTPFFQSLVGKMADSLNHLIFTMPYLPSEGVSKVVNIDNTTVPVIVFKHLPYLWYKYPIPDDIRLFWYNERPDILKYMIENYSQLKIDLYPDYIIKASDHLHLIN